MPPRTAAQILAEWHELAQQRDEASDSEIADGIAARIEQIRREYIEGTPPDAQPTERPEADPGPTVQTNMRL